ncbi:hypothetical protein [Nocardia veterana]|uniref:Uncharacterized protein n=1 Tax=Nocardia veterana TaxID=132249 RepID=A0A7X6M1W5_9NOCA|nr:hypothetical protein [Nocardia veterana]NKY88738.1 hypothetical protein [Nocardia veterana]
MTIYSRQPQGGDIRIVATHHTPGGVLSSTVTTVKSDATAARIVDALNRISACASIPLGVTDRRGGGFERYPDRHLAALTDRAARAGLREGTHSLWYEQVMWLLYEALTDLDDATVEAPAPVRSALATELEAEARSLRNALAEYSLTAEAGDDDTRRIWDLENPLVTFDGRSAGLDSRDRDLLDHLEAEGTDRELRDAIIDLRLILDIDAQVDDPDIRLQLEDLSITAEPGDAEDLFLTVAAPLPGGRHNRGQWGVALDRWEADETDDEGYPVQSHGEPVLRCVLAERPKITDVVELLRLADTQQQLAEWADTPVGEPLADTAFVVTDRHDDADGPSYSE